MMMTILANYKMKLRPHLIVLIILLKLFPHTYN